MLNGPVVVTGASGRLGRALVETLRVAQTDLRTWGRPDYDLDTVAAGDALLDRDEPKLVIHAAAWTDVDACAREPELARRRNGDAVAELAASCRSRGVRLLLVSTNEVFDGRRTDDRGYRENDQVGAINAYGASKLAGEDAARAAFGGAEADLWIVRTSWLFGPPGAAFPDKILAAAARVPAGGSLRVLADEFGCPTYAADLASAIVKLTRMDHGGGTYHLVNAGNTSRAGWAERVLRRQGVNVRLEPIAQGDYPRASTPPVWGVLDASKASVLGINLRPWEQALDDYLAESASR